MSELDQLGVPEYKVDEAIVFRASRLVAELLHGEA